jgi:hypothetical protein
MKIIDYIQEEVERQGHDTRQSDGLWRIIWMLDAWRYAQFEDNNGSFFLSTVEKLGCMIEPTKNAGGIRRCQVYVGTRECPNSRDLRWLLARWWKNLDSMTPLEAYKEFEMIHPFVDGNGRTGKIILNWKNGTLDDPIFPPADLWGEPIANP